MKQEESAIRTRDESATPKATKGEKSLRGHGLKEVGIVLIVLMGMVLTVSLLNVGLSLDRSFRGEALASEQTPEGGSSERTDHDHIWIPEVRTIHHDAVTEEVTHDPVYEDRVVFHTICNQCSATIDGIAREHIERTGHTGYSTNVPIHETVMCAEAFTECVVVEEGWDETISDGMICGICGISR